MFCSDYCQQSTSLYQRVVLRANIYLFISDKTARVNSIISLLFEDSHTKLNPIMDQSNAAAVPQMLKMEPQQTTADGNRGKSSTFIPTGEFERNDIKSIKCYRSLSGFVV